MIITFSNNKGGVLKTTLATNVAAQLAKKHRVCLIDFDGQSNVASTFKSNRDLKKIQYTLIDYLDNKITEIDLIDKDANATIAKMKNFNLDMIYSNHELNQYDFYLMKRRFTNDRIKELLERLNHLYDYVVIDTPPNLSTLTSIALNYASVIVIPFEPDKYAVKGMKMMCDVLEENFKSRDKRIIAVATKFSKRNRLHNEYMNVIQSYFETIRDQLNITLADEVISYSTRSSLAVASENVPLILSQQRGEMTDRLKEEIVNLTEEIITPDK